MHNPLEQFTIKKIIDLSILGFDISFTNSSLAMMASVIVICLGLFLATKQTSIIPSKLAMGAELIYKMVLNLLRSNAGPKAEQFIPIIFSLFLFVLVCNLFGMLPYGFTATSHIAVTFSLAMLVFSTVTFVGFMNHGMHFLSLFLPAGVPLWLAPMMIIIELFTYLARPISLSLRLGANMIAGHVLLKILAGFIILLPMVYKIAPFPVIIILIAFEIFVCMLQAYIFAILSCVYLNDALNLH